MKTIHWISLLLLAAISGSSFIFTRAIAPVLGPTVTADLRVLLGGGTLLIYAAAIRFDPDWKRNWKLYAVIGLINSGIPFFLYSFAALYIPASYSAIVNSSAPLFGALFSALWLNDRLTLNKLFGLALGMTGVALISYSGSNANLSPMFGYAIAACIGAAMCYALSGIVIKRFAKGIKPLAIAGCTQFAAGILMLPFWGAQPVTGMVTTSVILNLAALAVVCSAVAYLIYFWLIGEIGPTRTLTVTFLTPFYAMLWGAVFLGEAVTPLMLAGCVAIVCATMLVNRAPAAPQIKTA